MAIDIERLMVTRWGAGKGGRRPGFLRPALAAFLSYLQKRNTRWDLGDLTEEQLRDIGVTRTEARVEVSKSWFWD